jgi:quercetin dioxygenase-like cupin family protein
MSTTTPAQASRFVPISPGVEMRTLRVHPDGGRTFMIRMDPGARAPFHDQPGGEETFLLSGDLRIVDRLDAAGLALPDATLGEGEYFYASSGERHAGISDKGALFFVVAAGGVVPA